MLAAIAKNVALQLLCVSTVSVAIIPPFRYFDTGFPTVPEMGAGGGGNYSIGRIVSSLSSVSLSHSRRNSSSLSPAYFSTDAPPTTHAVTSARLSALVCCVTKRPRQFSHVERRLYTLADWLSARRTRGMDCDWSVYKSLPRRPETLRCLRKPIRLITDLCCVV